MRTFNEGPFVEVQAAQREYEKWDDLEKTRCVGKRYYTQDMLSVLDELGLPSDFMQ